MKKISKFDLLRLYVRSFFVQTSWTFDRMMALGFVWILKPLMPKFCSTPKEQSDFLKRHLVSFNANPYLASYALGAVTRLEEDETHPEQILRFKELLRGPLGALGDNLIWQNLRPALLILGLILTGRFGIWGALSVWLAFNLYQIYLRARGIMKGYSLGMGISSDLNRGHLQSLTKWSSRMGAGFMGILLVLKCDQMSVQALEPEKIIPFLSFILLSFLSFRRNVNPGYVLFSFLVIFLGVKVLFSWI
jgi:mannose/fructose/N-acetylgalactosamine-specific phosphotransferase system component IID